MRYPRQGMRCFYLNGMEARRFRCFRHAYPEFQQNILGDTRLKEFKEWGPYRTRRCYSLRYGNVLRLAIKGLNNDYSDLSNQKTTVPGALLFVDCKAMLAGVCLSDVLPPHPAHYLFARFADSRDQLYLATANYHAMCSTAAHSFLHEKKCDQLDEPPSWSLSSRWLIMGTVLYIFRCLLD